MGPVEDDEVEDDEPVQKTTIALLDELVDAVYRVGTTEHQHTNEFVNLVDGLYAIAESLMEVARAIRATNSPVDRAKRHG